MSETERHFSNQKIFKSSLSIKLKKEKRSYSLKSQSSLTLNKSIYKKDTKILNGNLLVLNYIMNCSQKNFSAKTALTDSSPENFRYDLSMINKYEENINSSLSFISNFDLEEDFINNKESFNSEEEQEDDNFEIIEIKSKYNKKVKNYSYKDVLFDDKINKEFLEIKNILLCKK